MTNAARRRDELVRRTRRKAELARFLRPERYCDAEIRVISPWTDEELKELETFRDVTDKARP